MLAATAWLIALDKQCQSMSARFSIELVGVGASDPDGDSQIGKYTREGVRPTQPQPWLGALSGAECRHADPSCRSRGAIATSSPTNACTVHDSTRQHRPSVSLQTGEIEKRSWFSDYIPSLPSLYLSWWLLFALLCPPSFRPSAFIFSFPPSPTLTQSPSRCNLASGDYLLRPFRSTRKSEKGKEKDIKRKGEELRRTR